MNKAAILYTLITIAIISSVESTAQDNDEAWLNDDFELKILEMSEGELRFIEPVTDEKTLHSEIVLSLSKQSLMSGWIKIEQCYFDIHPIGKTDVVYKFKKIRKLKINSFNNDAGKLYLDTWFEGILNINIEFENK